MKKITKLLSIFLSSIILLSCFNIVTSAEGYHYQNYNGFVYTLDINDKPVITNYNGKELNVIVPSEINGLKVYSIEGYGKIEKLHVPDDVIIYRLTNAKNLKKITVNKTNKKYSVKNNLLLNKNKSILYACPRKNTNPKIPKSVKKFDSYAFYGSNIKKIKLSKNLKSIGYQAFAQCKSLKSLKIPNNVKNVDDSAFLGCKNLKDITLSKNTKSLVTTFASCKSLKRIEIPKSVKEIGVGTFYNCKALKKIYIYNKKCEISFIEDSGIDSLISIPEHVTIYGYKGSTAQKYAKKNGNKFVKLD